MSILIIEDTQSKRPTFPIGKAKQHCCHEIERFVFTKCEENINQINIRGREANNTEINKPYHSLVDWYK